LGKEESKLRIYVLKSKYGTWRSILDRKDSIYNSMWWRDLKRACGYGEGEKWFMDNIIMQLRKVLF